MDEIRNEERQEETEAVQMGRQEWHQVGEDTGGGSRERRPWRGDKRKRKESWDNRATQKWTQKAARKNDDPLRVTSGDRKRGAEAGPLQRPPC